jgi:hypothetical protein
MAIIKSVFNTFRTYAIVTEKLDFEIASLRRNDVNAY